MLRNRIGIGIAANGLQSKTWYLKETYSNNLVTPAKVALKKIYFGALLILKLGYKIIVCQLFWMANFEF